MQETLSSLTGKQWRVFRPDPTQALYMRQLHGIPDMLARVALRRGISPEGYAAYSDPTIRALLPEPYHLLDMEKAAEHIAGLIAEGRPVGVIGDYDVDGATSSALLALMFRACGVRCEVFIPDRAKDGYGPCNRAFDLFLAQGIRDAITVDCGASAFAPLAYAAGKGIRTVVLDHHIGAAQLPEAHAVVNPNRADETSPHTYLAAVGVTFLCLVAVHRLLRQRGFFSGERAEPDLRQWLDIVALGTVCDVVPLKGINRAFVRQGLKILGMRRNVGLSALLDVAGVKDAPDVYHLGFALGPRINAGGRVGDSGLGVRLLTETDRAAAEDVAQTLGRYNAERKALEEQATEEAFLQLEGRTEEHPVLFAVGAGWHEGVIGIVSGRLKDRFHRPTAVLSVKGGVAKASARSIEGADVGAAIVAANQAGILIAGGGHAMAGGFSVAEDRIDELHRFLCARLAGDVARHAVPVLTLDAVVSLPAATAALAESLEACAPYGMANPKPRFLFSDVQLLKIDVLGGSHYRCFLKDAMRASGGSVKAMLFRAEGSPLGQALRACVGKRLAVAGTLAVNRWQGNASAEIHIEDIALQETVAAAFGEGREAVCG
jgi:single-stranded-DNA-specific exonuclease